QGLAGLAEVRATDLGRVVRVGGPPVAVYAFQRALRLAFSAFSAQATESAMSEVFGECKAPGEGLPDEVQVEWTGCAARILDPAAERRVRIRLDLELDPPQFGRLRELAVRDPDLVDALSQATMSVTLGWVFTKDFSVCSVSHTAVQLGGVRLDAHEHPWLPGFLASLTNRGLVVPPLAQHHRYAFAAHTSPSPQVRAGVAAMHSALRRRPFSLGELHPVEAEKSWWALGPELLPIGGAAHKQAISLVSAVHVSGAEILVLERPTALCERPRAVNNWLVAQATEEASPLEQVFILGEGTPDIVLATERQAPPAAGLTFPT
ncbi:MAG: hypothetical protein GY884_29390, partial [Proteobacteria bacterium]|nr:hypothetical protein [Pseudomonadota bacterium]